jgi:hypothetical protein
MVVSRGRSECLDKDARTMPTRYRSNAPRFVDETIDGEALIMDMLKGSYFSCVGVSAFAWNALIAGASVPELAASLSAAYAVPTDDATRDVQQYVDALVAEEMLVEAVDASTPTLAPPDPEATGAYASPEIERFTDLADLILLDPVHDVTEAGWPHATS